MTYSITPLQVFNHGTISDGIVGLASKTQDNNNNNNNKNNNNKNNNNKNNNKNTDKNNNKNNNNNKKNNNKNNTNIIETSSFFGENKPKTIIVISSQVGCASKCKFCEMGAEPFIRNLTINEMFDQVKLMQEQLQEKIPQLKKPIKITFANVGEPLLNPNLIPTIKTLAKENFSFKISTILPNSQFCKIQFKKLAEFANLYKNSVQIQISLISTNQKKRSELAGISLLQFEEIQKLGKLWCELNPKGRKINLSLILTEDNLCSINEIKEFFSPAIFRFRFRPYIQTSNGKNNNLNQISQINLQKLKLEFQDAGFEIYDFAIPSKTEKEFGLVSTSFRKRYLNSVKKQLK